MTITVGARTAPTVTCVMDGRSNSIIHPIIRLLSVKEITVRRDHVQDSTHRKKKEMSKVGFLATLFAMSQKIGL